MSALNAAVYALQYGLPLLSYAKLALPFVTAGAVNYFVHLTQLSTPEETLVMLPNVDTIYSAAVFDLSSNDVNVTIPLIDADRYWSFAFYDPFGNNFATPSSVHDNVAGNYLLRYAPGDKWGLHTTNSSDNCSSLYQGYINSPTTNGALLGRILVKNNLTDLEHVQSLVNESKLTTVPNNRIAPASLTKDSIAPYQSNNSALAVLQLLANFNGTNPAFNISTKSAQELQANLLHAGIHGLNYTQPRGLNLTKAYAIALTSIEAGAPNFTVPFNNGWIHNIPQGLYGDNFVDRAATAQAGYLEMTSDQSLYPSRENGVMHLNSNESYIYKFSRKPPLPSDGFWSLTLYNSEGFLVANDLNRYEVGDRSNLTYSDGTLVYSNLTAASRDRPFQVLIQSAAVTPPTNWASNWLPAPADSSNFSATLRLYAPGPEFWTGSYQFPVVEKKPAILV